jgi:uncharacterized protein YdaU (DUF1376 family)
MATEKAPAFQFYPKDWLSDPNVLAMTHTQRGIYVDLLAHLWLAQRMQRSEPFLARILGLRPSEFARHWSALAPCFRVVTVDGVDYIEHPRLEKERQKQQQFRTATSERGKRGAAARWQGHASSIAQALPEQCSPMALQSSSSSSSSSAEEDGERALADKALETVLPKRGINPKRQEHRIVNPGDPVELWSWQFDAFVKRAHAKFGDQAWQKVDTWVRNVGEKLRTSGELVTDDGKTWWHLRFKQDFDRIANRPTYYVAPRPEGSAA